MLFQRRQKVSMGSKSLSLTWSKNDSFYQVYWFQLKIKKLIFITHPYLQYVIVSVIVYKLCYIQSGKNMNLSVKRAFCNFLVSIEMKESFLRVPEILIV